MKYSLWRWMRLQITPSAAIPRRQYLLRIQQDNQRLYESLNRQCEDLKVLAETLSRTLTRR
jgi:hypothetical protein